MAALDTIKDWAKRHPEEARWIIIGVVAVMVLAAGGWYLQQDNFSAPATTSSNTSTTEVYTETTSSSASGMATIIRNSSDQYLDILRSDFERRIAAYEPRPVKMDRPRAGLIDMTFILKDGSTLKVRFTDTAPYQRLKFIH